MYPFLDWFFVVFHSLIIGFNLMGWIWRRTRRLHLLVLGLTFASWLGLGLFYGFGYCPSTDWHWQVKRKLGETGLPSSYVKYYVDRLTGMDWNPAWVDTSVLLLGLVALFFSIFLNRQDFQKRQHSTSDKGLDRI